MRAPMVPAAATVPVASDGSYLLRIISGTAMRPIAAAHATDDPVTAENPAAPKIVATARPPGNPDNHFRAASNKP